MLIKIIKIGKTDSSCKELAGRYQKRLRSWARIECHEFRSDDQALKYLTAPQNKASAKTVCLDERGKLWSSPELADFIRGNQENAGVRCLNFVVGSPYGLSSELQQFCDFSWSLSPAVFPSDLAWVLTNEQIYRAFSIIKGSPYHHV